jgi:hypothetical protein
MLQPTRTKTRAAEQSALDSPNAGVLMPKSRVFISSTSFYLRRVREDIEHRRWCREKQ